MQTATHIAKRKERGFRPLSPSERCWTAMELEAYAFGVCGNECAFEGSVFVYDRNAARNLNSAAHILPSSHQGIQRGLDI